ncbi:MAG: HD domain-containing protein [Candidatus Lokiarchaeota archaeon]|nr:HD domain-containing protein [Candidatus Lokiarchaeota archaeon]
MDFETMIAKVHTFAYEHSKKDDIHGFKHTERVLKQSLEIGIKLNANLTVLKIATLLHDIGRNIKSRETVENHAESSADIAEKFIYNNNFDLSIINIKNILHCIRSHSFSNNKIPKTLEAKILSDADKLDALGAIGLYRTIGFTILRKGGLNDVVEHLENKILKLKTQLFLDISKEIASSREKIIINFYERIKEQK